MAHSQALRAKLVEEGQEVALALPSELATELTGVLKILDSILDTYGIELVTVKLLQ